MNRSSPTLSFQTLRILLLSAAVTVVFVRVGLQGAGHGHSAGLAKMITKCRFFVGRGGTEGSDLNSPGKSRECLAHFPSQTKRALRKGEGGEEGVMNYQNDFQLKLQVWEPTDTCM